MKSFALAIAIALSQGLISRGPIALADPVTPERVAALPAAEQSAWQAYLDGSKAAAAKDQAALDAELVANGLPAALPSPDGGDFKVSAKAGDAFYASPEAKTLADTILSYQTPSGGWSKHAGYSKGSRKPGMLFSSQYKPGDKPHYLATFDNHSTTAQIEFLAYLVQATEREDCRAAIVKGLDFVLAAQNPSGGWPQVYPLEGGYHDDITFNDDAMTHVLELLQAVADKQPEYAFIDEARRAKAAAALQQGIDCLLKIQIELNGKKTVWCAQYDALTLQPSNGRKMEPATLSGGESAKILKFLMTLPKPSPPLIAGIESGLAWFESSKITGMVKTTRDGKTAYDPDPASTEIYWARFSDLKTGKPIFPGRDGVVYPTFNEMAAHNKLGYDYYTTSPDSLVNNGQKKWRKMVGQTSVAK